MGALINRFKKKRGGNAPPVDPNAVTNATTTNAPGMTENVDPTMQSPVVPGTNVDPNMQVDPNLAPGPVVPQPDPTQLGTQ